MFAILALAGAVSAYANTTTVEATKYTTIPCPTPTTVTYGSSTITVSEATTLTIEDCSCSATPSVAAAATSSAGPILANGAVAGKVGAAAGVAAVAAYLL